MGLWGTDGKADFVGFYWTLPLPGVGFRSLPTSVDAAAEKSRTIRYQREAVRRHVAQVKGRLIDEFVFMEVSPDRATEHVEDAVTRALQRSYETDATLLFVEFAMEGGWRSHPFMSRLMGQARVSCVGLPPEPLMVDGALFDPIDHFRTSRASVVGPDRATRQARIDTALRDLLAQDSGGAGRAERLAEALNRRGIHTVNGKPWTAANVRQALKKLS